ncbi:hypothetical protein SHAM105786_18210 [Shewanella amazonensis]|uniref:Phage shock protein B n=1 Tax=Shewanella amazonensis (strain ATCC BAA-1098 / SB2B) TaxID=326297 RepID=A1S5Z6_SHEAM|nr:hypothetical protein [Shewanella amazonensis]ABL99802.1 conserved hypothetical protein [Shewanella amazonensis SB2B]
MSIPMLALFIPILAITCGFVLQFMRLRERQQLLGSEHKAELAILHGEINQLKSRIEVLEKLVTDEGFDLEREINRMKGE